MMMTGMLRIALLDLVEQREARLAGHADVGDQHLRLARRASACSTSYADANDWYANAFARERLLEHPADRAVVVDDPDRFHRGDRAAVRAS